MGIITFASSFAGGVICAVVGAVVPRCLAWCSSQLVFFLLGVVPSWSKRVRSAARRSKVNWITLSNVWDHHSKQRVPLCGPHTFCTVAMLSFAPKVVMMVRVLKHNICSTMFFQREESFTQTRSNATISSLRFKHCHVVSSKTVLRLERVLWRSRRRRSKCPRVACTGEEGFAKWKSLGYDGGLDVRSRCRH